MAILKTLNTASKHCIILFSGSLLVACGGGSSGGDMSGSGAPSYSADVSATMSDDQSILAGRKTRITQPSTDPASTSPTSPTPTASCAFPDWTAGKYYSTGTIVRYPANGRYYRAKNENPGYDPIISTWYWEPYTAACSNTSTSTAPAPQPAPAQDCSFPNWVAGQWVVAGTIVRHPANGNFYRAMNDNPGYDPTLSTWYWQPHTCSGTTTQTSSGFIVTEAQFNQMFPNRSSFYTYAGLVSAMSAYPAIFNSGSDVVRKQEAAAFLANVHHETGGLQYIREINQANWSHYCQASGQYPCASGQQYFGRGPIQLSWNYNYGAAGQALGLNLLADPDLVARDATVAWKTAMWFWMTQTGGAATTPSRSMVNSIGFGETIRAINGGLECNKPAGSVGNQQMQTRVTYYRQFTQLLGVATGNNLTC